MLFHVIAEMATLAHGFQVIAPRAVWLAAEVRDGEHDHPSSEQCRPPVELNAPPRPPSPSPMQTTFANTLALLHAVAVRGPLEDLHADSLPIFRIVSFYERHSVVVDFAGATRAAARGDTARSPGMHSKTVQSAQGKSMFQTNDPAFRWNLL